MKSANGEIYNMFLKRVSAMRQHRADGSSRGDKAGAQTAMPNSGTKVAFLTGVPPSVAQSDPREY